MKSKTLLTTLATAGAAAPVTGSADLSATVLAFRESGTQITTCIAGLIDFLEEPLKAKFLAVKDQINTALAGLPATDQIPAASQASAILENLLSVLVRAQETIGYLGQQAIAHSGTIQTIRASLGGEVETAVKNKIAAGELVTKADHETAVAQAKETAKQTALASLQAEQGRITTRRTALASLQLPIPSDAVLAAGEDTDFNAKQAIAKARAEELAAFKLPANRLTTLAWDTDDAAYKTIFETLKEAKTTAGGIAHIAPRTPGAANTAGNGCVV